MQNRKFSVTRTKPTKISKRAAAAFQAHDLRRELFTLQLSRYQREVEIRHLSVCGGCTCQHLPQSLWRGCHADAREAPTESSRLAAGQGSDFAPATDAVVAHVRLPRGWTGSSHAGL